MNIIVCSFKKLGHFRGAWVAQLVKRRALDLSAGRELTVRGTEPCSGLRDGSAEPVWDSLFPSLSAPPLLTVSFSLSQNK